MAYHIPVRYNRSFECVDCGAETTRMRQSGEPLVCLDCGVDRHIAEVRQLAARKGPYYEAWKLAGGPRGRPRTPTPVE